MEPHEKVGASRGKIFVNNFIGGIAWSLGATFGLVIILTILTFIVAQINLVPIVGSFITDVVREVLQKNPQLLK